MGVATPQGIAVLTLILGLLFFSIGYFSQASNSGKVAGLPHPDAVGLEEEVLDARRLRDSTQRVTDDVSRQSVNQHKASKVGALPSLRSFPIVGDASPHDLTEAEFLSLVKKKRKNVGESHPVGKSTSPQQQNQQGTTPAEKVERSSLDEVESSSPVVRANVDPVRDGANQRVKGRDSHSDSAGSSTSSDAQSQERGVLDAPPVDEHSANNASGQHQQPPGKAFMASEEMQAQLKWLRTISPERPMDTPTPFRCPGFRYPSTKSADGKSASESIQKYSRYVTDYCNRTGLLQMNVPLKTYVFMLDQIAKIGRVKPNTRIMDWGCGCGTMLNYYYVKYNTSGFGLDITSNAISHAQRYAQPRQQFCLMDGSDLRMFPDNYFDAILAWATVYHIRRSLVQCNVVHQFVRILKPGSIAFMGHIRTEKSQAYWRKPKCKPPGAVLMRSRDYKTFRQPSWKLHQFFSVIIHKLRENETTVAPRTDIEL